MDWPVQQGIYAMGDLALQSGDVLPDARLSWKAHGTLAADRGNVIVYPTSFSAHHSDIEWLIGPNAVLDPARWFIVIPDMFGNGLSSSPSNTPDYPVLVTAADNIRAQQQMLAEHFGIPRVTAVYGWSMGAQQAYHWAALFPDLVDCIVVNCGSARTSTHNKVFLAGLLAILEAAGEYEGRGRFRASPRSALRAFGRNYAGWALSQEFYRAGTHLEAFGAKSLEAFLEANWDGRFGHRDAANLHAHLTTWYHADISDNDLYRGDLALALSSIRARVLLMPGRSDLYFRVADNEQELPHLRHGRLIPIPSDWGHLAGNPQRNPADAAFLRRTVSAWLDA